MVPGWPFSLDRVAELAHADLVAADDVVLIITWVAEPIAFGALVIVGSDPEAAAIKGKAMAKLHVGKPAVSEPDRQVAPGQVPDGKPELRNGNGDREPGDRIVLVDEYLNPGVFSRYTNSRNEWPPPLTPPRVVPAADRAASPMPVAEASGRTARARSRIVRQRTGAAAGAPGRLRREPAGQRRNLEKRRGEGRGPVS